MGQADFKSGSPCMVDLTPGSSLTAGDVLVVGDMPLIAHRDIAANALGAMGAGGGVYQVTASGAIGAGVKIYWDDAANKVTATASTHKLFGWSLTAAAADNDPVMGLHRPGV